MEVYSGWWWPLFRRILGSGGGLAGVLIYSCDVLDDAVVFSNYFYADVEKQARKHTMEEAGFC